MDTYYEKNGIVVRPTKLEDVGYLAGRLRQSDVEEIWASNHIKAYPALYEGFKTSVMTLTVEDNKDVVAMFGINPENLSGDKAVIWLLASKKLDKIKFRFLKNSKKFIEMFLNMYPYLYNYTDARNTQAIEWLKFCGATIEEAKPFGYDMKPFHYFYFSRN